MRLQDLKPQDLANITFACTVIDNKDPAQKARLRLRFPVIHDEVADKDLPWSRALQNTNGLNVPQIGQVVYGSFDQGNLNSPCYGGNVISDNFFQGSPFVGEDYPDVRGFFDGENFIVWNKKKKKIVVKTSGDIDIEAAKTVTITSGAGTTVNVGANATFNVDGDTNISSGGNVNVSGTDVNVSASGDANVTAGGMVNVSGTMINLN